MQKTKITQDLLRKKMNEHKKKLSIAVKKIDCPLAKYTDSGQLMCILCKTSVRNESAWVLHLNSKLHRENVEVAKRTKLESVRATKHAAFKRPHTAAHQEASPVKKLKNSNGPNKAHDLLPADFFDDSVPVSSNLSGASSLRVKKPENMETESVVVDDTAATKENKKEKDFSLPEGFFDDPILDAKVRNVEYKDPIEEEWERFQKEIKEESVQSAQIIADDQEEATTERQLEEIEEQIRNWSRVMDLVKLKESVHRDEPKQDEAFDDDSSTEDMEYNEDMDWRAKKSKQ